MNQWFGCCERRDFEETGVVKEKTTRTVLPQEGGAAGGLMAPHLTQVTTQQEHRLHSVLHTVSIRAFGMLCSGLLVSRLCSLLQQDILGGSPVLTVPVSDLRLLPVTIPPWRQPRGKS